MSGPSLLKSPSGYWLGPSGGLAGDDLLNELVRLGFFVRRYGDQAALDDDMGLGRGPPMPRLGRVPPMPLIYRFADKQAEYGAALTALKASYELITPTRGKKAAV